MSTAIAKNFQVGSDSTATNNFTIRQPATPDGTVRIANGNSGTTTDLVTVTSAGNVGVGTTSPSYRLQAASAGAVAEIVASNSAGAERIHLLSRSSAGVSYLQSQNSNFLVGTFDNYYTAFITNNTERMRLDNSGNLGIGTSSPVYKLDVQGGRTLATANSETYSIGVRNRASLAPNGNYWIGATNAVSPDMVFSNNAGTENMRLTDSGNLGLGVTPSADWASSSYKAFVVRTSFLAGSTAPGVMALGNNAYNDGAGWKYVATGVASYYVQNAGAHSWSYAPSGTAGNAISFTQAMTLDASGNLGINSTSPSTFGKVTVQVAGTTTPTNLTNVGPSSINLYAAANGGSTDSTMGIFGWNSTTGIGSGIGFVRESSSDWGTQIRFYTHPTTTSNIGDITERARITSGGDFCVGTTSAISTYGLVHVRGASKGVVIQNSTDNAYRAIYGQSGNLYFYNGTNEGYLSTAGAWVNASDGRLKTNVRGIEYGLATVLATQPRHYERVDVEGTYIGFVAQELQTVIPEVVSGDPEKQLGVDYGSLVAVAFKAIQELKAELDSVKTELALLKGTA